MTGRATSTHQVRAADKSRGPGKAGGPGKTGGGRCPICRAETEAGYRPFCSRRCADVDLGRWLGNGYAIPGNVETEEDGSLPVLGGPDPDDGSMPDD